MNTSLIEIDPDQARAKLKAYRASKHKDAEQLYSQVADAYEAAAKGLPLIELSKAIQEAGYFPEMRPKLAIARADRYEVRFDWRSHQSEATFISLSQRARSTANTWRSDTLNVTVAMGKEHGRRRGPDDRWGVDVYGFARVPMVPADVRPRYGQLADWHILWEVEAWSDKSHASPPPRDPYLLKQVGGDLWAVLAEWDLTDLERAVMRQQVRR